MSILYFGWMRNMRFGRRDAVLLQYSGSLVRMPCYTTLSLPNIQASTIVALLSET